MNQAKPTTRVRAAEHRISVLERALEEMRQEMALLTRQVRFLGDCIDAARADNRRVGALVIRNGGE